MIESQETGVPGVSSLLKERRFARLAAFVFALIMAMPLELAVFAAPPSMKLDPATQRMVLTSGRLELVIEMKKGVNPCSLRDLRSGRVYADGPYAWFEHFRPTLVGKPKIVDQDNTCSVTFKEAGDTLEIEHTFSASAAEPDLITEQIKLHNPGPNPVIASLFSCGFTKTIHDGKNWLPGVADSRLCDVPYRRHPETGELCDWTVPELAARKNWYSTARSAIYNRQESWIYGAEGWAWHQGGNTLLVSKYNPDSLEWSLVEVTPNSAPKNARRSLRFGGVGQWKLGDPEGASHLAPGGTFSFGPTRYQVVDGDWRQAYAAFRRFMADKGHVTPPKFDPPVHWNELYDNPLWWTAETSGLTVENLKKYYQKKDMQVEADKAKEIGCGCLYLDPGWDTLFGSNIWGADRLGPQEEFVRWLKQDYGMALALHTPLAPWSEPGTYPPDARRMDKSGNRLGELCTSSSAYRQTKVARLKELCKHGAYFLMYDGSWYPGECWDKSHGHSLPVTHQEHLDAILKIQQEVHKEYPNVLIEQHDPMTGPGTPRYAPTYFMHAKPGAFDELWGYEYMVDCMNDVRSRRACSLYYFNLAYGIPVYLHIDLRTDNRQALVFWWFASTCRHLGIGGKSKDPAIWTAHKNAMKTYSGLKRFYAQGIFYGLDESIHCHTLPDLEQSVINCFNLDDQPVKKEVRFRPSDIGLPAGRVQVEGAPFRQSGDEVVLDVAIPARGHLLLKVMLADKNHVSD
jgi:hypothetical protein